MRVFSGLLLAAAMLLQFSLFGQSYKGLYLYKNTDSTEYVKFTFLNQVWLRYTEHNSGSTLFGNEVSNRFDIGLRRTRMQLFGNVYKNTFVYMQMGINNFSPTSSRKIGIFFHDAVIQHDVIKDKIAIGGGLTGWNGLSRYSAPSVGSILSVDAPLFAQTTNDLTDQFLRKLSIYAKGQISKLDYRLLLTTPMAIQQSGKEKSISTISTFSSKPSQHQYAGYIKWQFFDKESNLTPYAKGTYLGAKKIINLGAGFQYQDGAQWHLESGGDTVETAMQNYAVDVFIELPIDSARKDAITAFFAHYWFDFGPNFIRNIGAMNPANGNSDPLIVNGGGSAAPILGTGRAYYSQLAYLLPTTIIDEKYGRWQPYGAYMHANYDYLNEIMTLYDVGINWYRNGNSNKITFSYQNRPVFKTNEDFQNVESDRKGLYILQLQVTL